MPHFTAAKALMTHGDDVEKSSMRYFYEAAGRCPGGARTGHSFSTGRGQSSSCCSNTWRPPANTQPRTATHTHTSPLLFTSESGVPTLVFMSLLQCCTGQCVLCLPRPLYPPPQIKRLKRWPGSLTLGHTHTHAQKRWDVCRWQSAHRLQHAIGSEFLQGPGRHEEFSMSLSW